MRAATIRLPQGRLLGYIPGSRLHLFPGEEHYLVIERWGEILDALVDGGIR